MNGNPLRAARARCVVDPGCPAIEMAARRMLLHGIRKYPSKRHDGGLRKGQPRSTHANHCQPSSVVAAVGGDRTENFAEQDADGAPDQGAVRIREQGAENQPDDRANRRAAPDGPGGGEDFCVDQVVGQTGGSIVFRVIPFGRRR